jgi:hypothetical protein
LISYAIDFPGHWLASTIRLALAPGIFSSVPLECGMDSSMNSMIDHPAWTCFSAPVRCSAIIFTSKRRTGTTCHHKKSSDFPHLQYYSWFQQSVFINTTQQDNRSGACLSQTPSIPVEALTASLAATSLARGGGSRNFNTNIVPIAAQ